MCGIRQMSRLAIARPGASPRAVFARSVPRVIRIACASGLLSDPARNRRARSSHRRASCTSNTVLPRTVALILPTESRNAALRSLARRPARIRLASLSPFKFFRSILAVQDGGPVAQGRRNWISCVRCVSTVCAFGREMARKIGDYVLANYMTPLK